MPHVFHQGVGLRPSKPLRAWRKAMARRLSKTHRARSVLSEPVQLEPLEARVVFHAGMVHFEPLIDPIHDSTVTAVTTDTSESQAPAATLSDTFSLHSNPGASHTIYLDFDGHITQNTTWNSWKGISTIETPAYDFDGDLLSFSDAELTRIQYIFQRVAEDFLPFDVNVTTQEPPLSDLVKSGSSDSRWGIRVVIGGSSNDWLGQAAGGVAWVGSFNSSSDTPVFAFEAQLNNGAEKHVTEAVSHEVGHALGLNHDGTSTQGYYTGHGSGETGWAPIMGVGYGKNLTQWSRGEYAGASNTQDDLSIITTQNGFGYRADDHGNSLGSATPLTVSGNAVNGSGIIERNTDFDLFSFNTDAGTINLDILPAQRGANLDVLAELLDANGKVIASSNPLDLLSAGIDTSVSAGEYFVRITGTGKGDPANGGYSDYGSLGQYTISGQMVAGPPSISVDDVTVNEADGTAVFTVRLSQASSGTVTVNAFTVNGTAVSGDDFQSVNQTLTFDPGQLTQTVTVPILNDTSTENTESFTLRLDNAIGEATIFDDQAVGTILDDDASVSVTVNNVTVNEADGTAVFTVQLSGASSGVVTVNAATANGSAVSGSDYQMVDQTLTFNPGQTSQTVTVPILNDSATEPSETFKLNLSNVTGNATISDSQGIATIHDNDAVVFVNVSDISANEGNPRKGKNGGPKSTNFTFTINLSDPATQDVTVQYATQDNTAVSGEDYTAKSGSVTFNPGETTKTVTVTVVGDGVVEADEQFYLNLLSATNATVSDSQGAGMIINDDSSGGGGKGGGKGGPKKSLPLAAAGAAQLSYASTQAPSQSSPPSFSFSLHDIFESSHDDH